ncbi:MAG: methyltransferase domain-containing protein [Anaerolineae bacterium]|nr:methyltransferase domain-containing protein [Anaerolineae bacterium]
MAILAGDYYAESHKIFRQATDQQQLMLVEVIQRVQRAAKLSILSVGSGVGLFEVPLLEQLIERGVEITKFIGNDIDPYSCALLTQKLTNSFGGTLDYEVVADPFEDFVSSDRFDLILFTHVFEYLPKDHLKWLKKAQDFLTDDGHIFIFSPNKPGINKIYAETFQTLHGYSPLFTAELKKIIIKGGLPFKSKEIQAECDISLLKEKKISSQGLMLLSFLVQIDCRVIPTKTQNEYLEYFISLQLPGKASIPHPTTMFII